MLKTRRTRIITQTESEADRASVTRSEDAMRDHIVLSEQMELLKDENKKRKRDFKGNMWNPNGKVMIMNGLVWEPKLPTLASCAKLGSSSSKSSNNVAESSVLWRPKNELVDGLFVPPNDPKKLNKILKKKVKDTAGTNWFDMPAPTMTPELKKDLQLLKLRNVIDPKRHYKKGSSKSKTLPKYFQVGTVVESTSDFYSGRLTKKERKATIADELLSDRHLENYRKRKVREIEEKNHPASNDKWKIKGKTTRKRAKERRH